MTVHVCTTVRTCVVLASSRVYDCSYARDIPCTLTLMLVCLELVLDLMATIESWHYSWAYALNLCYICL